MIKALTLLSVLLFIYSFKLFTKPSTARNANILAASGMGVAVVITIYTNIDISNLLFWIVILGSVSIGYLLAKLVKMTEMPELVALFNGLGGGASGLIAYVDLVYNGASIISIFSLIIGSLTISGSFIAVLKLRNKLNLNKRYFVVVNIVSLSFFILLGF